MDIDKLLAQPFHQGVLTFNTELANQWKLLALNRFPFNRFIVDGD